MQITPCRLPLRQQRSVTIFPIGKYRLFGIALMPLGRPGGGSRMDCRIGQCAQLTDKTVHIAGGRIVSFQNAGLQIQIPH